ncbi:MAG: TIGR03619 family F420-dependent LLM class oxidoreductase [Actinomycetota bacterium]
MKVRVGFGLSALALAGWNESSFLSIVDACEHLGWDSIWFSERVSSDAPDPLVAMAAVAGRTRRLKFGPSVMILPGRNPLLLAKQLATLDVISNGRLVVAFGLGVDARAERAIFAVDRAEAAARTDEAVALMRLAWTQERVTFAGRFHQVEDVAVGPRPAQRPHPDVWFGGVSGPALRRVGRLGDGWLPSFITVAEYREKAEVIRKIAADEGRQVDEEHFGALVPYLPVGMPGEEQVLEFVAKRRPGVDPRAMIALGGPAALRARLAQFVDQGASKFVITPVLTPGDWDAELGTLRSEVAAPLEV